MRPSSVSTPNRSRPAAWKLANFTQRLPSTCNLGQVDPQILGELHGRRPPRSEHAAAGMLERPHEIEALDAGHGELTEFRRWPVRTGLVRRRRDTVQVAVVETRRRALHVERTVAVV